MMGTADSSLAHEQAQVDRIYAVLDRTRDSYRAEQARVAAAPAAGSPQNRSERDALAAHYGDQAQRLANVENRLVFGRLDPLEGEERYIGRAGLSDEGKPVLIDWRAPAARPFYQATPANPLGMARRRHLFVHNRKVLSVEDDVLDRSHARTTQMSLTGSGALIAALDKARSGHMGDIVTTIQAEQDAIIRSESTGVVVVQGGPGTGKTAVALHRAAYLLYTHAERLSRSGVLVLGPSPVFLRYIEQVLPALGETGVVSKTIGDLVPGVSARGSESADLAALKGDMRWVTILARATRTLERVPLDGLTFTHDGVTFWLSPLEIARARQRGREEPTHNEGRAPFVRRVLSALTDSFMAAARREGYGVAPHDRDSIQEDLRRDINVRREVNLCWMPYTPEAFLRRLLSHPDLLARAAGDLLSADEIAALTRPADAPLTEADIVLIDQLTETLGEFQDPRSLGQAARERATRTHELANAEAVLANAGMTPGLVHASQLVERASGPLRGVALAERANADREWVYGHIVVDEAQELSPLAWNALLRRCPSSSFTIVGDLDQRRRSDPGATWIDLLGPLARAKPEVSVLTVCYRTPSSIMAAADRVLAAAGRAPQFPTRPVRDLPEALSVTRSPLSPDAVADAVAQEARRLDTEIGEGQGKIAVVVPAGQAARFEWGRDLIGERIVCLEAAWSKGLEFDTIVLVDPATIGRESPGDLYVAMTRPTRRLRVLHDGRLPAGLVDDDGSR